MALSNNRRRAVEIEEELRRRKQMEQYRQNQRNLGLNDAVDVYNKARGTYNNVTGFGNRLQGYGNNLNNLGTRMGQVNNPRVASLGSRVQQLGNKFNTWGSKFNALNGGSQAGANAFGQGGNSALGQMGTMAGNSGGASSGILGNAIASQTAGSAGAGASGAGSGALGSAIAGQTAAGSAGAGTAAGSGALAGSIGSATGGTAAATGATAGGIGAGAGGAAAGGTAAAGAAGGATAAAGGAAMAVPVAGWIIAAAAAAKMIKDKIDQEHKKVNAKAMQADDMNMKASAQANAQRVQDAQQMFAQTAEQDAQAMSNQANQQQTGVTGQLPDMSQYMSPDDLADDMNAQLEESKEPVQDGDNSALANSMLSGIGGQATGGAAPISNNTPQVQPVQLYDNSYDANNQPAKIWDNNTQSAIYDAQQAGITDKSTLDNMAQGLNGGNKDIAGLIDKYSIRKPSTNEEIALAKNGEFNQPIQPTNTSTNTQQNINVTPSATKRSLMEKIAGGLKDFGAGYEDNTTHGFKQGDVYQNAMNKLNPSYQNGVLTGGASKTSKSFMNRLGEFAGTGQRVLANPLTQGLIAGTIAGIQDRDIGTGLLTGYEWAGKKAKSNDYYRRLHPNTDYIPVFGGEYDANDYNAQTNADYRQVMGEIRQQAQDDDHAQNFGKAGDVWEAYKNTDPEYYKEIVGDPNFDPDAEISKKDVEKYIEARRKQNKDNFDKDYKNTQNAERSRHNKAMEGIGYGNLGVRKAALEESKKQHAFDNSIKSKKLVDSNDIADLNLAKLEYEQKSKMIENMGLDEDEYEEAMAELSQRYLTKVSNITSRRKNSSTNTSINTVKPERVNGGLAF